MFTLGMATYDDYDGVYFTVQSARLFHPDVSEIVILDNNPTSVHGSKNKLLENWSSENCKIRYIPFEGKQGTSIRNNIFQYASNEHVIVSDSHVLFLPNSISSLKQYYYNDFKNYDFIQGPLVYDDCYTYSTHLENEWRDNFYGIWAKKDSTEKYFEIDNMGLGVFSCKKSQWLGINELFKGFGGEEGYLHKKYIKRGGRCICLQDFKWMHRFERVNGVPYKNILEDRLFNFLVGRFELDSNYTDVIEYFSNHSLNKDIVQNVFKNAFEAFYKKPCNIDLF